MARKRFGQNFLADPGIVDQIVATIAPRHDDAVVEIGPGHGAITGPLAAKLDRLDVIEIDCDLASSIVARFSNEPNIVQLIGHNALGFDYSAHAVKRGKPIRLVGSLAYNIGTPLLFQTLDIFDAITDMHFMLQKEVVDRIVACPGERSYGRLSVGVAVRANAISLFDVPPSAFRPQPKVNSAFVRIKPAKERPDIFDWRLFNQMLTDAFGKRRKTCRNALSGWLSAEQINALGIDPQRRPAELSPNDYVALANAATKHDL